MTQSDSLKIILKKYWGYDEFRPLQKDIIQNVMSGHDTFALLPTGGGKSICYQLPAVAMPGICIVITPLLSLMNDQVEDLQKRGIKCLSISSSMRKNEIDHALDNAIYGDFKLIYISPERIQSELFIERFKKMKVSFIAVDESHCISQWGYDFRPSYRNIKDLREHQEVPILALTATATPFVSEDIQVNLEFTESKVFSKSFRRENIEFNVIRTDNKMGYLLDFCENQKECIIVYARNRRKCREISEILNSNGRKSMYYHAGLSHEIRQKNQHRWMEGEVPIMVATNAFGMGIDKSDVRKVIHWDLPDSLEAFYQEAGRAGRDGKKSHSYVLFNKQDELSLNENFDQSFPPIDFIKNTYLHLANYYQISAGSGFMASMPFHLEDFCRRFDLRKKETFHAMQQLEKTGLITLSEGFYQPSRVKINRGKTDLIQFQRENPKYQNIISFLLRAYSGIIDEEVVVDESMIGRKIQADRKEVIQKLSYLKKTGLIEYESKHGQPLLTLLTERKKLSEIQIPKKDYLKRKEAQLVRIQRVLDYCKSTKCRMKELLSYFGEEKAEECMVCDNCKKKHQSIPMKDLKKQILHNMGQQKMSIKEIESRFEFHLRDDIRKACRELCEDEIIELKERNSFLRR